MYNPHIHYRRSIRLKNYDYSGEGLYFITICAQNNACLFGNIVDDELHLNDAGQMVEKWCFELTNKFPDIDLGEYVVMPNHFHGIIINSGCGNPNIANNAPPVGANLCVRPNEHPANIVGADLCVCPNGTNAKNIDLCERNKGEHIGSPLRQRNVSIWGEHAGSPLYRIVQWFKTMTTNEYIRGVKTLSWQPFNKRLWQRNYHEHIIRTPKSHDEIANYILSNPQNWLKDKFHYH